MLNLYPYNPGHSMVVPYRRVSELEDLTDAESAELMAFTQKVIRVIKSVSQPHGFNVGLNLGKSAGGSLAEHLHMHVVPRWSGDANFITIIGGSKVVPQLLRETRELLADGMGEAVVSDFYLMTRAAYEKLLDAGRQGCAAGRLHPRQHHDHRHRGRGDRRPDAVSRSGSCGGARSRSASSCSPTCSTVRWPASAAAAPGSARCSTPPATGSATARSSAGCCGGRRSACAARRWWWPLMICLVTSQVISYVKARAEASGLSGEGGLIERPERLIIVLLGAGLSGLPFLHVPWLLHVARGCWRWPA